MSPQMTNAEIEDALGRAERAVGSGRPLRGTGFWPAVDACRRDPALAARYAGPIGAIDRHAFERGVRLRVRISIGIAALFVGAVLGEAAITWATYAELGSDIGRAAPFITDHRLRGAVVPVAFLAGLGLVIVCTHCLAHWIIGRLLGIRFTHVFLGGPPPPRPGLKTDYASFLRTSPRARALMFASGAIVTKLVPFVLLWNALLLADDWPWLVWVVLAIGVVQILTDVFLSTKVSDWKKVRRELDAARAAS